MLSSEWERCVWVTHLVTPAVFLPRSRASKGRYPAMEMRESLCADDVLAESANELEHELAFAYRPGIAAAGEQMADQAFDGHRFEPLSPLEDMQALRLGIQLHRQTLASELAGNGIRLQVNPDRAMGIDFAFHMPAMQPLQPAIRVNNLRQRTQGGQGGKSAARRLVATAERLVGSLEVVMLDKGEGSLTGLL